MPLNESAAVIEDEFLRKSCADLFNYVSVAFNEMYENPTVYAFDPCESISGAIEDRVCFHRNILESFLDIALDIQADVLVMNTIEYDKLIQNTEKKWKQKKILPRGFTFADQLKTLERHGMKIQRGNIETSIINTVYPQLFLAAKLLHSAATEQYKKTKRTSQNFILCDFNALHNCNRKIQLDDILDPLRDDEKLRAHEIVRYLSDSESSIKSEFNFYYYRFAKYSYKKRDLFFFRWNSHHYASGLEVGICLSYPGQDEYSLIQNEIDKVDNAEEIKEFCSCNIKPCVFCNRNCVQNNAYKKNWLIFGYPVKKLIASCGGCLVCLNELDEVALEYVKILLDIHIRIIDQIT